MAREIATWQANCNAAIARINWQFKAAGARKKLKRLYPSFEVWQGKSLRDRCLVSEVRLASVRLGSGGKGSQ